MKRRPRERLASVRRRARRKARRARPAPLRWRVVDLFAGPGGWDLAAHALGMDPLGVETDAAACRTREAAGLRTLQADVAALDPVRFVDEGRDGLIASPPCQAYSMAGKGGGRRDVLHVEQCAHDVAAGEDTREAHAAACEDPRSILVVEPLRWAIALRPRWIALEQVPPVLPLWELFAQLLRAEGYRVWTGVLSAERYGVPQTRERAILLAHRELAVGAPAATHQRYIPPRRREEASLSLFDAPEPERIVAPEDAHLRPWRSMAEALGWGMTRRPSSTVAAKVGGTGGHRPLEAGSGGRELLRREREAGDWIEAPPWSPEDEVGFPRRNDLDDGGEYRERDLRTADQPAFALTEKARSWQRFTVNTGRDWKEGGSRDTAQTFDADERPAPTIDGKGRWQVVVDEETDAPAWIVDTGNTRSGTRTEGRWRETSEPAAVVTSRADQLEWRDERAAAVEDPPTHLRAGTNERDALRAVDEPAPTMRFGERLNSVDWMYDRPATTLAGDPRVFQPGGHHANDGRVSDPETDGRSRNTVRVSIAEALVLQSFPPDYPLQGTKTKQFEQVGNAVPPLFAWRILQAVAR